MMKTKLAWHSNHASSFVSFLLGLIHVVRTQNLPNSISYPLIRTHTFAYQGVRKASFSENCGRTKLMIPYICINLIKDILNVNKLLIT